MVKWKSLPTNPEALKERWMKLKDKEAKLEADLAIREHPTLEEAITQVVLAMVEVRKLDTAIMKAPKPEDLQDRKQVEGLCNQIEFYRRKIEAANLSLLELGGRSAEKFVELKQNRVRALEQLLVIFETAEEDFAKQGMQLKLLLPSIVDFV